MYFPEGRLEATKLASGAVEKMDDHDIVPNPQNFTVWYVHLSGRDAALSRKVEELVQGEQGFDEVRCAELYSTYLSSAGIAVDNESAEEIDRISAELERTISETTEIISGAGVESEQFAETLASASGDLTSADSGEQLKHVVASLIDHTRRMAEQNRRANDRLKQSNGEIAALRVRVAEVRTEALQDPLTGLANRRAFTERLGDAVVEAESEKGPVALLMFDIDHFKKFNDTYGHQLGDQVIRMVAGCAMSNIKGRDTAARYGGEEFAIILPNTDLQGGLALAEQIRAAMAGHKIVRKSTRESLGSVTVSVGVSQYRIGESQEDFIARADAALYAAKHSGRNCVKGEDEENVVIDLPLDKTAAALAQ